MRKVITENEKDRFKTIYSAVEPRHIMREIYRAEEKSKGYDSRKLLRSIAHW
jgi:hypothetical protein